MNFCTKEKTRAYNIIMEKSEKSVEKELVKNGCRIKYDVPAFGAFGSGGKVAKVVCPKDGYALSKAAKILGGEKVVLGGATNVLFPDGGFDGVAVTTGEIKDVFRKGNRVYCGAGVRLPDLVKKCAKYGLSGLEQLSGIPGSAGGAIAMNAGAFGREMAELIARVDAVTAEGEVVALSRYALDPAYRHTCIAEKGLTVLGAELALTPSSEREIRTSVEEYRKRRRNSQPAGRSLGSVFKRVDGISAGYYIERAGLKGEKKGGAEISERHANFIVNSGGATGADFLYLAELARRRVFDKFGITLEYEVIFL